MALLSPTAPTLFLHTGTKVPNCIPVLPGRRKVHCPVRSAWELELLEMPLKERRFGAAGGIVRETPF